MKTLFIQLARLGDIYMTWPTLRAYHRTHPNTEIHILVREKFKEALFGIGIPLKIHVLPSAEVVEATEFSGFDSGLRQLKEFAQGLTQESFQSLINLSFSPFSSHLVKYLELGSEKAHSSVSVKGYTRTDDGFLKLPDDWSAYFFSQVGIQRENRLHVTDIFAEVSGVSLSPVDFSAPVVENLADGADVIIHIGGSEQKKRISLEVYKQVLQTLFSDRSELKDPRVWIVGSGQEEFQFAESLTAEFPRCTVTNKVNNFTLPQLISLIDQASLLIAPDSVTLHISSLTQTPVLNLSSNVNFWETGPKSPVSAVLEIKNSVIDLSELSRVINGLLKSEVLSSPKTFETVGWSLIEFIYFGGTPPKVRAALVEPLQQFRETNELMIKTLSSLEDKGRDELQVQVLERGDEILKLISDHFSDIQVLYRWYACEKMRIGPGTFESVCIETLNVHERLAKILETISPRKTEIKALVSRIKSGCQSLVHAKSLNEKSLQEIVERLFEFSQISIQIVSEENQNLCFELSRLLEEFLALLTKKEFNEIKLLLEYDMISHFQAWEESLSGPTERRQQPESQPRGSAGLD